MSWQSPSSGSAEWNEIVTMPWPWLCWRLLGPSASNVHLQRQPTWLLMLPVSKAIVAANPFQVCPMMRSKNSQRHEMKSAHLNAIAPVPCLCHQTSRLCSDPLPSYLNCRAPSPQFPSPTPGTSPRSSSQFRPHKSQPSQIYHKSCRRVQNRPIPPRTARSIRLPLFSCLHIRVQGNSCCRRPRAYLLRNEPRRRGSCRCFHRFHLWRLR